jgi:transposase
MADFSWFSDDQWSRIEPLLPNNGKGARRVDDRRVLFGIVHALQSGGRWGDCPPIYGPKKHSATASCAGPYAVSGRISSTHWQEPRVCQSHSTCIKAHRTVGGAKGAWPMVSA